LNHLEDNIEYKNKSFRGLLQELRKIATKTRDLVGLVIIQGHKEGFSNEQIREELLNVMSYQTMLEYIPQEMKQEQHHVKSRQKVVYSQPSYKRDQSRLVIEDEPPNIPPIPQPIIEQEHHAKKIVDKHIEPEPLLPPKQITQAILPKSLVNSLAWTRAWPIAKACGEEFIRLKVNSDGVLSL
jgi:hypothetical protein